MCKAQALMLGSSQSIMLLIGFGICAAGFLYICVPYLHGRYLRIWLGDKAAKSSALVLTFDDGPGNKLTPAILDILEEHDVKASFFLLGRNITGREEIVRRIAEQGHEICSHGYDHLQYWKVSPLRALSDIKRGWETIDAALELKREKYPFRPPYGKLNIICLLYLLIRQVPIIYWSLDLEDTWAAQPDSHRTTLLAQRAGGAVSLAHDFDRSDESRDESVIEFVRSALSMAKEKNLRVLTVSQLLSDRP
jgi:peptidoglycan/xylan/chitin deacetylase (PgdA/CDA1 family)